MFLLKAFGRQSKRHLRAGFTLIELLVVVLIIGILAAVAVPQYELAVEKARAAEAVGNVSVLYRAQQRYYMANGKYSDDINDVDVQIPGVQSTMSGRNRKRTAWFSYGLKDGATDEVETAVANRLPEESAYAFVVQQGELKCSAINALGKKICRNMGVRLLSSGAWGEVWFIGKL